MKTYKHLTKEERCLIYFLWNKEKYSMNKIAKILNKNKSTISRELKRNTSSTGIYYSSTAHKKYIRRKSNCHMFFMLKYKNFTDLFIQKFNPKSHGVEATIFWIKKNYPLVKVPSARQVFRWINSKIWKIQRRDCLRRKYVKGKRRKIGIFSKIDGKYCIPYSLRPEKINNRKEFGHWEADLIVSKRQSGYYHLLTLVERKTRLAIIRKIKGKNARSMMAKMYTIIRDEKLPIKSITVDNGLEFQMMGITAKQFNFKVYYCQPYSSFQRGSNENINGIVRRWYKKGTDFSLVSEDKIKTLEWKVNNIPRKMFGYKTAYQMYQENI
ncbi:IS30 family transposase [Malacoplasma iowae]|uniref:IS30 family transposase n=1 Tax=Malacoplasma iowae TaxID=2116 RepID=UPI002A189A4C|nr:IS30 family transposase [Malacoplasma iowae]WPL37934.1 IS30 family transposase [Malacoplasma iowae]WPL41266.1 IS30 family transposase [Malacoplasma iowae]